MKNIIKRTVEKLTGKTTYYVVSAGKVTKKTTSIEDREFYKRLYGEVFNTHQEAEDYKDYKEVVDTLCK